MAKGWRTAFLLKEESDLARRIMDTEEFRFKINAFTPETIPMARLAEYMREFALLLGNLDSVHFDRLEAGSTQIISRAEFEAIPKVNQRVLEAANDEGPDELRATVGRVNAMLRDDNATGSLYNRAGAQIIRFPGREIPKPVKIGPLTSRVTVDGELVRIGGADKTAHAWIVDASGKQWNGETDRKLAKELAQYLYGARLRAEGTARWERLAEGEWELKTFKLHSFTVLSSETLLDSVEKLRAIEGSDWSSMKDPLTFLSNQRKDGDVH